MVTVNCETVVGAASMLEGGDTAFSSEMSTASAPVVSARPARPIGSQRPP
jgi:hypothetical protein